MADIKKQFPEITKALGVQDTALALYYQDGGPKSAPIVAACAGFAEVADMTADVGLLYSNVAAGDIVLAGYSRYIVVAAATASPDVTTAGGVKLNLLAGGTADFDLNDYLLKTGGDLTGDIDSKTGNGHNFDSPDGTKTNKVANANSGKLQVDGDPFVINHHRQLAISGTAFDPVATTWNEKNRQRPIKFLNEGRSWYYDGFDLDRGYTELTLSGGASTISTTNARLKISHNAAAVDMLYRSNFKPFFTGFQVMSNILAFTATGTKGIAKCGVVLDSNNFLVAEFDVVNGNWAVIERVSGVDNTLVSGSAGAWTTAFKFGLQVLGDEVSFLFDRASSGVTSLGNASGMAFSKTQLATMYGCLGFEADNVAFEQMSFGDLAVGPLTHFGYAHPNLVTFEDGTPVEADGKMRIMGTFAHADAAGVSGLMSYNPRNFTTNYPDAIFDFKDVSAASEYRTNGACIFDRNAGLWRIFISGWGSATGVTEGVTMFTTDQTNLDGVITLTGGVDLSLPLGANGGDAAYDPSFLWDGTQWYCAYTLWDTAGSTFWPALATSADLVTWALVDEDTTQTACSGTKITVMGGNIRVFATTRTGVRIYDNTLTLLGTQTGLTTTSAPAPPPQFLPIPIRGRGFTAWHGMQFNDKRALSVSVDTWGDLVVYLASTTQTGFEFETEPYLF